MLRFIVATLALSSTLAGAATAMDASLVGPADLVGSVLPSLPAAPDVRVPDALRLVDAGPALAALGDHAVGARHLLDADLDIVPLYLLPDGGLLAGLYGAPLAADGAPLYRDALPALPPPVARPAALPSSTPLEFSDAPHAPLNDDAGASAAPAPGPARAQTRVAAPPSSNIEAPAKVLAAGGAVAASLVALGFALYHRIRPHSTLQNDTRKQIFDSVCATPGLGVHAIAERASVSYSTTVYHLERLQGAGMIVMTPDGNKLCYYKNGGAFTEAERKILPVLKNEEAARLFEAILDSPGTYRAELAQKLGVTATTINWHLRRLRGAGLVHEMRSGRNAHLFANVDVMQTALPGLAIKIAGSDAAVAERIRRYGLPVSSAGPASPA